VPSTTSSEKEEAHGRSRAEWSQHSRGSLAEPPVEVAAARDKIHADLTTARGLNTVSYTIAPSTPPRRGPSQYTHQLSKNPEATAGPSHRPGLIAAPVNPPPKSQSMPTVSPMGIAPSVFAAPRESIAVAKTTKTTRNVIRSSRSIPAAGVIPFTAGVASRRPAVICAG